MPLSSCALAKVATILSLITGQTCASASTGSLSSKPTTSSYGFNVSAKSSNFDLRASTSERLQLSGDLIDIREARNQSIWDLQWSWPSISGLGRWEWYCPDDLCGGVGWYQFPSGPITFPHSWILTNSVRWNPVGTSPAQITVVANGTIYGHSININMTLTSTLSSANVTSKQLPVSSTSCKGMQLNSTGQVEINLPFGPFIVNSPIRPICVQQTVNNGSTAYIGDVLVTVTKTTSVQISTWIDIHNSTRLPAGFKLVKFLGQNTSVGAGSSAFVVTLSVETPITVILPPVQYPDAMDIKDRSMLVAMQFDSSSGNVHPVIVSAWDADTLAPSRATITLPGSGVYIFGYLNPAINTLLPAFYGSSIPYLSSWGTKQYSFSSVNVSVKSSTDLTLSVNPAQVVITTKDTSVDSFSVGFDTSSSPEVTLVYGKAGYVWAQFIASQSTVGGSWQAISSNRSSTNVSARIASPGTYGVIPYVAPNAGDVFGRDSGSFYIRFLVLLFHLVFLLFQ